MDHRDKPLRLALVEGGSIVGKSSLFNLLLGEERLRSPARRRA